MKKLQQNNVPALGTMVPRYTLLSTFINNYYKNLEIITFEPKTLVMWYISFLFKFLKIPDRKTKSNMPYQNDKINRSLFFL